MSDLEAFRAETRAWLEANCPPGVRNLPETEDNAFWGGRNKVFKNEDQKLWFERMAERGWTVPEWPKQYGGGGLSRDEAKILASEIRRLGAKAPLYSLGIWMLGPALLKFGTEEQKLEHLPKIARGEIRWAQGYSEPGAGSDLASLKTKGEDMGDHFLVNGSKIWTSYGDKADWIFALVRTEPEAPKHLGISFLLIDMTTPGVSTSPIKMIAGDSHFTQTFFDNVKAEKKNLVGERGRGWDVTKYLLTHEREMIGSFQAGGVHETVAQFATRTIGKEGLARNGALRADILDFELDSWVLGIAVERIGDQTKAKEVSATSGSVLKVFGADLGMRRGELVLAVDGASGLDNGHASSQELLRAPVSKIGGGTTEIQLNVIAKRALNLPGA